LDICGIDIRLACIIHDYRYTAGETFHDKIDADVEFLYNLNLILSCSEEFDNINSNRRQKRFDKAYMYFMFVQLYGDKAFVAGAGIKNRDRKEYIADIPLDLEKVLEPPNKRGHEDDEML
jgi:hypothetical protein